jgi:DNA-binding HxlR family transcriptional regulator
VDVSTQVVEALTSGRGDVFDRKCPTRAVLDHVTGKWAVLVLVALRAGPLRYSALRRAIDGVSEKMLAQALRTLESDGFVHRAVAPTTPPQVTYSLTDLGGEVTEHLAGLLEWIDTHINDVLDARVRATNGAVVG